MKPSIADQKRAAEKEELQRKRQEMKAARQAKRDENVPDSSQF